MTDGQVVWDAYFDGMDLDVRSTGNSRWIDQKLQIDVLWVVADCIEQSAVDASLEFTAADIWGSEYAARTIPRVFAKPALDDPTARNEYNKFFAQPLELLATAGVLRKIKRGGRNYYTVQNAEVLHFIALHETNALEFLAEYVQRVLSASGLAVPFEAFFADPNANTYRDVKQAFVRFTNDNTPIRGDYEPRRIFTKVINTLAAVRGTRGSARGRISGDVIDLDDLRYVMANFRDLAVRKPKWITRENWARQRRALPGNTAYRATRAR